MATKTGHSFQCPWPYFLSVFQFIDFVYIPILTAPALLCTTDGKPLFYANYSFVPMYQPGVQFLMAAGTFSLLPYPDQVWDPPNFRSSGYKASSQELSSKSVKLMT